jgi:hypothetical protein
MVCSKRKPIRLSLQFLFEPIRYNSRSMRPGGFRLWPFRMWLVRFLLQYRWTGFRICNEQNCAKKSILLTVLKCTVPIYAKAVAKDTLMVVKMLHSILQGAKSFFPELKHVFITIILTHSLYKHCWWEASELQSFFQNNPLIVWDYKIQQRKQKQTECYNNNNLWIEIIAGKIANQFLIDFVYLHRNFTESFFSY